MTSCNGFPTNHMRGIFCLKQFSLYHMIPSYITKHMTFMGSYFLFMLSYLWPCFQIQHKGHIGNCISPFPLQQHSCFWGSPYFYGHSLVQYPQNVKQIASFLWITHVYRPSDIILIRGSGSVCGRGGLNIH